MRASKRAAIGVSIVCAAWAAGCLPPGHVNLNAPLSCASAGPGAVAGDCEGSAEGFEFGSRPAPGRRNPPINAVMTVTAYRHDGSVAARWQGPTRWVGAIPAAGMMFTGEVSRGRVTWDSASAQDVRVEMQQDGTGGSPLRRWLMDRTPDAVRVSVAVTRNGGSARGEVAVGASGGRTHGGKAVAGSPRAEGRGNASGAGRGRLRHGPREGGDGSHVTGTRGGSPLGSGERSSWADEPTAALSSRGGRVPGPEGAEGGSPAGTGEPGDHGLSVGTPVFGGVISVPRSIAPALDVAAMLSQAGASPSSLASKWIQRTLRFGVRGLRREIGKQAAKHAERAVAATRGRLSRSADFRRLSAAEQQEILDAMDDALRREYLARVEDGIAREIADIEQTLPRIRPLARTDDAWRHNERLLRENLEAARRVQEATRQARADLGRAPASTPAASFATKGVARPFPAGVDDVIASAARPSRAGSTTSRAVQALQKKLSNPSKAANFAGLKADEATANAIIREVFADQNPVFRTSTNRAGQEVIDVLNPSTGRGVRLVRESGAFDTFVNF